MTFRSRLAIAIAVAAAIPLTALSLGVRRELTRRLEDQAARRVQALASVAEQTLEAETGVVRRRLGGAAGQLGHDNRFRIALRGDPGARAWLLDWAGAAMDAGGLDVLMVTDSAGRILSSGHFRNEYDRLDPDLPRAVTAARGRPMLAAVRTPDGPVTILVGIDSVRVAGLVFRLVGGTAFDSARAARLSLDDVRVGLDSAGPGVAVARITLPWYDGTVSGARSLVISRDTEPLAALRRSVGTWFLVAMVLSLVLATGLAIVLSARIARPLTRLADTASRLDLDQLDLEFGLAREDEIGTLSRFLDGMTRRIRESLGRLREAERRAATGDIARQVNHDIKNGLIPIRNVLRHLGEVAQREPQQLPAVFAERRATLESGVQYLEDLARSYARLVPAAGSVSTDLNAIVRELAAHAPGRIELGLDEALRHVRAEPVPIRRIAENLITNALEALDDEEGGVTISTGPGQDGRVRLTITDRGRGMTAAELERAFEDFYTTKPGGTGLGLPVVRRLVDELGGTVRVETAPGQGSTVTVEVPAA